MLPWNVEVVFIGKASAAAELQVAKRYVRRSDAKFVGTVVQSAQIQGE
jgi:hypothetical protein